MERQRDASVLEGPYSGSHGLHEALWYDVSMF